MKTPTFVSSKVAKKMSARQFLCPCLPETFLPERESKATCPTLLRGAGLLMLAVSGLLVLDVHAQIPDGSPQVAMSFNTSPSPAPGTSVDKSQFNLFKPTPKENLRDINALYNGPYTVDAGHFQTETVVGLYAYDHNTEKGADFASSFTTYGSTTFRLGLLNNVDLGVTVVPHAEYRSRDRITGAIFSQSGFGDLTLRAKWNFWGDDAGSTAFGLVGFLKVPTSPIGVGNGYYEGGIGLPLAVELPKGWWLGITPEFHIFHDVNGGNGYHLNFNSTFFLWHQIVGNLSGYIESSNWITSEHPSPWISTLDLGVTYVYGKHLQLDGGAYIGMTPAANDIAPFLGISFRF